MTESNTLSPSSRKSSAGNGHHYQLCVPYSLRQICLPLISMFVAETAGTGCLGCTAGIARKPAAAAAEEADAGI